MRKLIFVVALLVTAAPAAFAGTGNGTATSPAQQCAAQRTGMGTSAFNQLYGTPAGHANAFGKCVSKMTHSDQNNTTNAAAACRAEQQADPDAFKTKYGTNANGRNAFGRCVSQKAKAAAQQQQKSLINAARACRAEQQPDPAAFKTKYGTNANKSNAFGKCVAQKAHA